MDVLGYLSLIISIAVTICVFKLNIFKKLKAFLYKLFWMDRFSGKRKLLIFYGKFTMYFYVFIIIFASIDILYNFYLLYIISIVLAIVIFPIMYWALMSFQKFMDGL